MNMPIFKTRIAIAIFVIATTCLSGNADAALVHSLDFEAGQGVGYTTTVPEFINDDWFSHGSAASFPALASYGNIQGNFFFSTYDTDDGGTVALPQSLNINNINISNFANLTLELFVAEDDDGASQDWDTTDFFHVFASIDGGAQFQIFGIEGSSSTATNTEPREDTNFDGVGDGTAITNNFTNFSKPIAGVGSTLDLELRFRLSANDEDIAIDNIVVRGDPTAVPEPGSFAIFAAAVVLLNRRRRRQ